MQNYEQHTFTVCAHDVSDFGERGHKVEHWGMLRLAPHHKILK